MEYKSCTSEHPLYLARNLLSETQHAPWRVLSADVKDAVVEFSLMPAQLIQSIEIGNDGSALVEISGGKRDQDADDFQTLLAITPFMSPSESNSNVSRNRVKKFVPPKLRNGDKPIEILRIKCTNPYNPKDRWGLSHIKVESTPVVTSPPSLDVNSFTTNNESKKNERRTSGFLFYNKSQEENNVTPLKSIPSNVSTTSTTSTTTTTTNNNKEKEKEKEKEKSIAHKPLTRKQSQELESKQTTTTTTTTSSKSNENSKPKHLFIPTGDSDTEEEPKTPVKKQKQNSESPKLETTSKTTSNKQIETKPTETKVAPPQRVSKRKSQDISNSSSSSDLTTTTTSAKKQKLDENESHPISPSIPKDKPNAKNFFSQDSDTEEEIPLEKKRRRALLMKENKSVDDDDTDPLIFEKLNNSKKQLSESGNSGVGAKLKQTASMTGEFDDDDFAKIVNKKKGNNTTPPKQQSPKSKSITPLRPSSDTEPEEEEEPLTKKAPAPKTTNKTTTNASKSNSSKSIVEKKSDSPLIQNKLPDILEKCRVYFDGDEMKDMKRIRKIVVMFGGALVSEPLEATHLVSEEKWKSEWDELQEQNPTLICVKPSWLFAVETAQKLVATQKHLIPAD